MKPSLAQRFVTAFLEGGRWKLYLQGLGTTLELTVVALIFGVLLGLVVAVVVLSAPPTTSSASAGRTPCWAF